MGGLLKSKPVVQAEQEPRRPRPTRLPTETDPALLTAQQRARQAAARRRGRQATILSDAVAPGANPERVATGSSGVKLGA